jgi:myosin heavy subunit
MKNWFKEETEDSVKKVRREMQKYVDNVHSSLEDLREASKEFEIGDTVDAESRSSQNIYEKMTEMVDNFEYPDEITYHQTLEMAKDLEKFLKRVMHIGRRFIPNLGRKYKTRVFVLNRALKRIQRDFKDLAKFLKKETKLLQKVDETSDNISNLMDKIEERKKLKKRIEKEREKVNEIREEIKQLNAEEENLESKEIMQELNKINEEISIIGNKLRLRIGGLDKPLRKLTSRAHDGIVMIRPDLVEIANKIQEEPEKVLMKMPEGHQKLNDLLEILLDAIDEDKLKIKSSFEDKTKELAEEIFNGLISDLHNELLTLKERKTILEKKVKEQELEAQIEEYQKKINQIKKRESLQKRQVQELEDELEKINDKIVKIAAETQKDIRKLTKKDIKIDITE